MENDFILCFDTSTTLCSAVVSKGREVLAQASIQEGYSHAENLHPMIAQLLSNANVPMSHLAAIVVGKGPGSYTGLRIGVSAAKGLAFALGIPLYALCSLEILALTASEKIALPEENVLWCPMMDARRAEVFTATYDGNWNVVRPVEAAVVHADWRDNQDKSRIMVFCGNGAFKWQAMANDFPNHVFLPEVYPEAVVMPELFLMRWRVGMRPVDTAYFEPFYLKEFFSPSFSKGL